MNVKLFIIIYKIYENHIRKFLRKRKNKFIPESKNIWRLTISKSTTKRRKQFSQKC